MDSLRRRDWQAGFTLVELLVVIVILGILIAVTVPTFLSQQNKAHDADAQVRLTTAAHSLKAMWTSDGEKLPEDASTIADELGNSEPELTPIGTDSTVCDQDTISLERVDDDDINIQTGSQDGSCFLYAAHFRGVDERLKSDGGSGDPPWNLAEDPNFDYEVAGDQPFARWSSGDPDPALSSQVTVDGSQAQSGANSLRVQMVADDSDSGADISFEGDSGARYTCSAYVKAGAGDSGAQARIDFDVNGDNGMLNAASHVFTLTSSWQRVSVSGTDPDPNYSNRCGIHPATGDEPAFTAFVDSVMINTGPTALPYFDGDTNGGTWVGEPGKSMSVGSTPTQTWVGW